jgi:hypothetical protein
LMHASWSWACEMAAEAMPKTKVVMSFMGGGRATNVP